MVFQEMVPWGKGRRNVTIRNAGSDFPLNTLQRRMNRMFDDFFGDFGDMGVSPLRALTRNIGDFAPRMDIAETEKELTVHAEIAGMDENDVEVTLKDGVLTITGEKKIERNEEKERYCLTERSSGTFSRSIVLPEDVEEDKIEATFKKGVLTVRLPKAPVEESKAKKIEIKSQ